MVDDVARCFWFEFGLDKRWMKIFGREFRFQVRLFFIEVAAIVCLQAGFIEKQQAKTQDPNWPSFRNPIACDVKQLACSRKK